MYVYGTFSIYVICEGDDVHLNIKAVSNKINIYINEQRTFEATVLEIWVIHLLLFKIR